MKPHCLSSLIIRVLLPFHILSRFSLFHSQGVCSLTLFGIPTTFFCIFVHLSCVSHALCVCRIYIIHIHIYIIYIYIRILYIHLFVHYIYIHIYILLQWIYSCKLQIYTLLYIYSHIYIYVNPSLYRPLSLRNSNNHNNRAKGK